MKTLSDVEVQLLLEQKRQKNCIAYIFDLLSVTVLYMYIYIIYTCMYVVKLLFGNFKGGGRKIPLASPKCNLDDISVHTCSYYYSMAHALHSFPMLVMFTARTCIALDRDLMHCRSQIPFCVLYIKVMRALIVLLPMY